MVSRSNFDPSLTMNRTGDITQALDVGKDRHQLNVLRVVEIGTAFATLMTMVMTSPFSKLTEQCTGSAIRPIRD